MILLFLATLLPLAVHSVAQQEPDAVQAVQARRKKLAVYDKLLTYKLGSQEWLTELKEVGIKHRRGISEWAFDGVCSRYLGKEQASRSFPLYRAVEWIRWDIWLYNRDFELEDTLAQLTRTLQYAEQLEEYAQQKAAYKALEARYEECRDEKLKADRKPRA